MVFNAHFLRAIPKAELHVHLDGSVRLETLIDAARANHVDLPSYTPEGLRELVFKSQYANLEEYLSGFGYICRSLRSKEFLERAAYELAIDNIREGVRYCEVRFAPQLMATPTFSLDEVIEAVYRGFARAQQEENGDQSVRDGQTPPFYFGIIICAMRMFRASFSPYFEGLIRQHPEQDIDLLARSAALEVAGKAVEWRDEYGIPVVGFDLAGPERGYPASHFREAYALVRGHCLWATVHAGEAYSAESIAQAVLFLNARRVGHGLNLLRADRVSDPAIEDRELYVERLAQCLADKEVALEVCLTSNSQTDPEYADLENHPIRQFIERDIQIVLCTDNRTISNTTLTREYEKFVSLVRPSEELMRSIVLNGFERSFFPGIRSEKLAYIKQIADWYDQTIKTASARERAV